MNPPPITAAAEASRAPAVSPEPLLRMLQGLQASGIVKAGIELAVFDQLAAGNSDARSIAPAIGADERGTTILLDALTALGLLEATGHEYRLTPIADAFLVSEHPGYLGGAANIFTGDWAWANYGRLADVIRHGGTLMEQDAETPGLEFWVTFAPSSEGFTTPAAQQLAEILEPWASERPRLDVLDVACGSGLYGLTLAHQHPDGHVALLDWANVLAQAHTNVDRLGLEDRTTYIAGDVFEVDLRGPYDVIIASHFFHHFSEQQCLDALRRLAGALKRGGRLVINEFTSTASNPADDPFPALFSVNMMVWSREGRAYPVSTYQRWLTAAGFLPAEIDDARGMPSRFLIAERTA